MRTVFLTYNRADEICSTLYYLIIKQSAQAATFRHYLQSRAGVRIYQQAFV